MRQSRLSPYGVESCPDGVAFLGTRRLVSPTIGKA